MLSATLARSVEVSGRGLFSGEPCRALLDPAPAGSGLCISTGSSTVPLTIDSVIERPSCTVIDIAGSEVAVVEHLLVALWACGIDTAKITVEGPELPNHDGSAQIYQHAICDAGRMEYGPRTELQLSKTLRVEEDGSYLQLEPADVMSVDYSFSHAELGAQRYVATLTREIAAAEILPARSFITDSEATAATAAGILHNSNIEDALVMLVADGTVRPTTPLRFPEEFARHKVLDLLGDLYLAPFEWTGKLSAYRSGHKLNRMLARKLVEEYRRHETEVWES